MAESFKLLKEEWIHPQGIQAETIRLAPIDLSPINNPVCMSWPFFYDYTVDATRLKEALEKLCVKYPILCGRVAPDEDVRFCLKVRKHGRLLKINVYGVPNRSIPRTIRRSASLSSRCKRT